MISRRVRVSVPDGLVGDEPQPEVVCESSQEHSMILLSRKMRQTCVRNNTTVIIVQAGVHRRPIQRLIVI